MSVGAQTKASGSSPAGEADGGGQGVDRGNAAGQLFGRLSVLPALLVMGWLVVGLPLLLLGWFRPLVMLLISVPVMALLAYLGVRLLPGRWQGAQPAGRPGLLAAPWWSVIGVIVVAIAFGADQMVYHSQFVIVTRDPGSYVQFAAWISGHGSLPIGQDNAAFGGVTSALSFVSPAFYQVGLTVVPQFMAGLPMVLAAGFWIGGVSTAVLIAPILGACAVLTFGGLVARLVGPRWAPLAALALALALPMEFTSRSTYSEPLAAILFLGGLCLVIDGLGADGAGARILAALGGLALGLTFLVRLDGASDILPVIPYCGVLFLCRRRQALPMTAGFILGAGYGVLDGTLLTWPYLQQNKTSVDPLALLLGALIVATVVTTLVVRLVARRRRRRPRTRKRLPQVRKRLSWIHWRWLPNAGAVVAVLVVLAFFVRPYVDIVRAKSSSSFQSSIAAAQMALGQPIDPARTYYEISLRWVFWYIGVPAVILGTAGAAIVVRRCLRGGLPSWTLPVLVFSWAIVTTLYRPAITPDQPWASRRLVPAVLPGFILFAVWAVSWLSNWLRERQLGRVVRGAVIACCGAALVLPATITTFDLGVQTGGPVGIRLTADGLGTKTTYAGEIGAASRLCAALPKNASVVFINSGPNKIGSQLVQVVRGMCDRPAAIMANMQPGTVLQVLSGIGRAGRQPVLLASYPEQLAQFGGTPRHILNLHTTADGGALIMPPVNTRALTVSVWMSEPPP